MNHCIPENHISYQSEEFIKKILCPLTDLVDIHYFCYGVNYPDTSGFTLHTNAKYYETWFTHNFPLSGFFLNSGWYFIDPAWPKEQYEIAKSMDIGNILTYVNRQKDKTEIFEFGTTPNNKKIINFYLNDHNILTKFIFLFLHQANTLISKAKKQLILPSEKRVLNVNSLSAGYESINHCPRLPQELTFPLNLLSKREMECYNLIIKGYSSIEISDHLKLSPKTINSFITRIKIKLRCSNRQSLIQKAYEAGLIDYFIKFQER